MDRTTLDLLNLNNINPNGPGGKVSAAAHREVNMALADYTDNVRASIADGSNLGLLSVDDTPPLVGNYRGDVFTAGTYTNFKDENGDPIVFTEAELLANIAYIYVSDNVATKVLSPKATVPLTQEIDPKGTTKATSEKAVAVRYDKVRRVLKSFVDVPAKAWGEILDRPSLLTDTILKTDYKTYADPTYETITINFADIPIEVTKIKIEGDFSKGGADVLTVLYGNEITGTYFQAFTGVQLGREFDFTIDRDLYQYVGITYYKTDFKLFYGGDDEGYTETDGVIKYIDKKTGPVLKALDYFTGAPGVGFSPQDLYGKIYYLNGYFNSAFGNTYKEGFAISLIYVSGIPAEFTKFRLYSSFLNVPFDGVIVFAANESQGKYDKLLIGATADPFIDVVIDRKYEYYSFSYELNSGESKLFYINENPEAPTDTVKQYIDKITQISEKTSARVPAPSQLLSLNFISVSTLPVAKGNIINGEIEYDDGAGTRFKKFARLEVQGSSSASFPKKNWTIYLYNDDLYTDEFKLKIGKLVEHKEFVFKSNWIDATHSRNIVSNHIWEQIIQSRKYYPKRENENIYTPGLADISARFDSGALCHVEGFPAELLINGVFYGLGSFNLGKKRENYDLVSSNQNHIQLQAETHTSLETYIPGDWDLRNPKTPNAGTITKINAWFSSNALSGAAFKAAFDTNHDIKNAVDFYIFEEFLMATDATDKNFIITSYDGTKFYFMPYDLDTVFGLRYDGQAFDDPNFNCLRNVLFWYKFYTAYSVEIKARYAELKALNILTADNVYKQFSEMAKVYGREKYKADLTKWPDIPSNSTVYTSVAQVMDWIKLRIAYLDTQYI